MAAILSSRQIFFTGSHTESWIFYEDSPEHLWHFEVLIDGLAQILTEILKFEVLTFLGPYGVINEAIHDRL